MRVFSIVAAFFLMMGFIYSQNVLTYHFTHTPQEANGMGPEHSGLVTQETFMAYRPSTFQVLEPANLQLIDTTLKEHQVLVSLADKELLKATKLTNAGIALGSIANLSLIINAGVYSGEINEWQGTVGLVGALSGATRLFISFAPPGHLKKAANLITQLQQQTGNEKSFADPLKHLRTARNAAIAVSFLGLGGMVLVPAGIHGLGNDKGYGPVCYSLGWACAVAGLTTSIISSVEISKANKAFQKELSTVDFGMNSSGVGLNYHF